MKVERVHADLSRHVFFVLQVLSECVDVTQPDVHAWLPCVHVNVQGVKMSFSRTLRPRAAQTVKKKHFKNRINVF